MSYHKIQKLARKWAAKEYFLKIATLNSLKRIIEPAFANVSEFNDYPVMKYLENAPNVYRGELNEGLALEVKDEKEPIFYLCSQEDILLETKNITECAIRYEEEIKKIKEEKRKKKENQYEENIPEFISVKFPYEVKGKVGPLEYTLHEISCDDINKLSIDVNWYYFHLNGKEHFISLYNSNNAFKNLWINGVKVTDAANNKDNAKIKNALNDPNSVSVSDIIDQLYNILNDATKQEQIKSNNTLFPGWNTKKESFISWIQNNMISNNMVSINMDELPF